MCAIVGFGHHLIARASPSPVGSITLRPTPLPRRFLTGTVEPSIVIVHYPAEVHLTRR
jgi:hypothetical protein